MGPPPPAARTTLSGDDIEGLKLVFFQFCSFGASRRITEMDGAKFIKFFRDSGLLGARITATDVDLIFAKARPVKGASKLRFDDFTWALHMAAERAGLDYRDLVIKAVGSGGPIANGTVAEPNKFHDDRSLYTGVSKQGGPTSVDNRVTIEGLIDRSFGDTTVRGIKLRVPTPQEKFGMEERQPKSPGRHLLGKPPGRTNGTRPSKAPARAPPPALKPASSALTPWDPATPAEGAAARGRLAAPSTALHDAFERFSTFGSGSPAQQPKGAGEVAKMDGFQFAKLCRDCGLLSVTFSAISADILFSKVKGRGERKITFAQFQQALEAVAALQGLGADAVESKVVASKGPLLTSSGMPTRVKLHDDKSLHTGMPKHAWVSPSNRASPPVSLREVVIRKGSGQTVQGSRGHPLHQRQPQLADGPAALQRSSSTGSSSSGQSHAAPGHSQGALEAAEVKHHRVEALSL